MYGDGRWTPELIAERLPSTVGVEKLPLIEKVKEMREAATSGERPNT